MCFAGQQDEENSEDEGSDGSIDMEHVGVDGVNVNEDELNAPDEDWVSDAVDFDQEANVARKVLENFVQSSANDDLSAPMKHEESNPDDVPEEQTKLSVQAAGESGASRPIKIEKSGPSILKPTEEEDLGTTLFISNLPFDIDKEEVKQRFSAFGEVLSFFPVLHPVTRYVFHWSSLKVLPLVASLSLSKGK